MGFDFSFMRRPFCLTNPDSQHKKIEIAPLPILSDIYRVKQKKIDTRMDDQLFKLVDGYARAHGMTRTQVVVAAVRQFFGMTPANPVAFAQSQGKTTPQNAPVGAEILRPSETFGSGSSTAPQPHSLKTGSDKFTT